MYFQARLAVTWKLSLFSCWNSVVELLVALILKNVSDYASVRPLNSMSSLIEKSVSWI